MVCLTLCECLWRVCLMIDQMSFWMTDWPTNGLVDWLVGLLIHDVSVDFSFTATVLSCYYSSVGPSSNLLSIQLSILHLKTRSIHPSIHPPVHPSVHCLPLPCINPSVLSSTHFYLSFSLCSQFSHVCFCLFACSGAQSQTKLVLECTTVRNLKV